MSQFLIFYEYMILKYICESYCFDFQDCLKGANDRSLVIQTYYGYFIYIY